MIAVISSWDTGYQSLADLVMPGREAYCRRHGYDVISRLDERPGGRSPIWSRCWIGMEVLERYDWLWLMDLDAVVMNPAIRLESLLDTTADLLVASDINGINSGSVFVRRSEWSAGFLRRWWDVGSRLGTWTCGEQTTLAHILPMEPCEKWAVLPQRACNSYRYEWYGLEYPAGQYQDGDFVIHMPGLSLDRRLEILRDMIR